MRHGWLYILHFDEPLAHACHYVGCTTQLRKRLETHAAGHGSRLTRELKARGIHWRLGALYQCNLTQMRIYERQIKNTHHAPDYCDCTGPARLLPGTIKYARELLDNAHNSQAIISPPPHPTTLQYYTPATTPAPIAEQIKTLMVLNSEELGFVPISETAAYKNLLTIQSPDADVYGYLIYSRNATANTITVNQACVDDQYRLREHGRTLISHLQSIHPGDTITAGVRQDLPANEFWSRIGFQLIGHGTHVTSRRIINHYTKEPIWNTASKKDAP